MAIEVVCVVGNTRKMSLIEDSSMGDIRNDCFRSHIYTPTNQQQWLRNRKS